MRDISGDVSDHDESDQDENEKNESDQDESGLDKNEKNESVHKNVPWALRSLNSIRP